MNAILYGLAYIVPVATALALVYGGGWSFVAPAIAFGFIPLVELIFPEYSRNLSPDEETRRRSSRAFDLLVYGTVPVQLALVFFFAYMLGNQGDRYATYEWIGIVWSMGVSCGVIGINVGHELGHRTRPHEKLFARLLLLSSSYVHFYIEHNRGHHRYVSTPEDPASARRGEALYGFWVRSIIMSYVSAWKLEKKRLNNLKRSAITLDNDMIYWQSIQLLFIAAVFAVGGVVGGLAFLGASLAGALLLETVNYIEHYGLSRRYDEKKRRYEKVQPMHSWNSDHPLGRLFLFDLPRHSDHHANANRPYQVLRRFDESPQMPTGYPGMMLLALIPPLWFSVMHRRIDNLHTTGALAEST